MTDVAPVRRPVCGAEGSEQPDEPVVSVVLAMRDAERYLHEQLTAIARQRCEVAWELVVADNGSTDGSIGIVEGFRDQLPALLLVDASAVAGAAAARNEGVRRARSRNIVFCDADDVVAPGWLAAMAEGLEQQPLVAAQVDHHSLNPAWTLEMRSSGAGLLQSDPPFLPYTFGAALGVRRTLHDELGGFDESLDVACEDRDYCYRAQLGGVELTLLPDAVVRYRHRTDPVPCYRQWRGYSWGSVRMYRDYRAYGLGKPPPARAVLAWPLLVARLLPALRSRRALAVWASRLGWRVGRLQASLRYRVWAP